MAFRSSQTIIQFKEDGCRYRTVLEENCQIEKSSGLRKCERAKRIFRKCPNDSIEIELKVNNDGEDIESKLSTKYDAIAQDV